MAVHINSFFANIGQTLANDIIGKKQTPTNISSNAPLNNNSDGMSNNLITPEEIANVLKKIDVKKALAVDNVRSNVIIDACLANLDRFAKMYNGSLTHCVFPEKWKYSTVIPLPKVSNPKTASDMRPISLLPLPGKILEHIISARLKKYLDVNAILTEKQHGFRKKQSTLSAIIKLLNEIY